MNTQKFIDSKPPESYNQAMWLSMSQRLAWLLQRWLNKGNGDPYYYFERLKTALFISDETELNTLFTGDFYQSEQFVSRYIDSCYWIIWREKVDDIEYFFVLCADPFYLDSLNDQYSFLYKLDKAKLTNQRQLTYTSMVLCLNHYKNIDKLTRLKLPLLKQAKLCILSLFNIITKTVKFISSNVNLSNTTY